MRVIFANRYFYPDESATSRMVSSLAFALAREGVEVVVLCSRHLHIGKEAQLAASETINNVSIRRLSTTGFGRGSSLGRMFDYLTYHLAAAAWLLLHGRRGDVCVMCTDPPLLSVSAAIPLQLRGVRLINWIMDLFPEVALDLKLVDETSRPARLALAMRDWSLRMAVANVCPIDSMAQYLGTRGIPADRLNVVHHWSESQELQPVPRWKNKLRRSWGFHDELVVGYSGNFGRAHDFSTILDAAGRLKDEKNVRFLFIGEGQQRAFVEGEIQRRGLRNITLQPLQPRDRLSESLSTADVHLVSLIPALERSVIPSKLYGILAVGRPTLFIGDPDGEVASVIEGAKCGTAVRIGEGKKLASLILQLRDKPEELERQGANAKRLFDAEYTSVSGVAAWRKVLDDLRRSEWQKAEGACPATGTVVVSQLGARMHYAVPRILQQNGALERLYTDICAVRSWPRLVGLLPTRLRPAGLRRLSGRVPAGVPRNKIRSFPMMGAFYVAGRLRATSETDETRLALAEAREFSKRVVRRGFGSASGFYGISGECLEQIEEAKRQGLWAVVEQIIAPRGTVDQLVAAEAARFPAWQGAFDADPMAAAFGAREKAEWAAADMVICPSEFVRGLVIETGVDASKCMLVPYGVDARVVGSKTERAPGPLRVLTVGEVGLRKGSPYVLAAARRLKGKAEFRMVGPSRLPPEIRGELAQVLTLTGVVPRSEMAAQMAWADVYLLPSVCEGSATSVYEALAAGLPVVCTENTGSVVRHGIDGFIVRSGDVDGIVGALEALNRNPTLRQAMSQNAREQAAEFTVARYGERLLAALAVLQRPKRVADFNLPLISQLKVG
jgi:glycosyltransferase involved in cell wall biosynthesis